MCCKNGPRNVLLALKIDVLKHKEGFLFRCVFVSCYCAQVCVCMRAYNNISFLVALNQNIN